MLLGSKVAFVYTKPPPPIVVTADLVTCWRRCQAGLKEGGILFLKENITSDNHFHIDKEDSSITRYVLPFAKPPPKPWLMPAAPVSASHHSVATVCNAM